MLTRSRDNVYFDNYFEILNIREKFNILIITRATRKRYST